MKTQRKSQPWSTPLQTQSYFKAMTKLKFHMQQHMINLTSVLFPHGSLYYREYPISKHNLNDEPLLQWCHNERDGVSNHQPHHCLLNRLFGLRSKKTSKLRDTGLCAANSPVSSPHKGPETRKMFPFDDVIMMSPGSHCWGLYSGTQSIVKSPKPMWI